jgi:hypothetical protein
MNTEMRELTSAELDAVSGGLDMPEWAWWLILPAVAVSPVLVGGALAGAAIATKK